MLNLSRDRLWLIGAGVASLLVFAFGYLLFISPQHSQAADLRSQVDDQVSNISVKQTHLNALAKQNQNLASYQAELAADQQALPTTTDIPNFLRSLQAIGAGTGVTITTMSIGTPSGVVPATASTAATPTPATGSTATDPPAQHAASTAGAYQISMTVTGTGSVAQLEAFLKSLQSQQPRAVLISSAALSTGTSSSGSTLTVTFTTFMAPAGG